MSGRKPSYQLKTNWLKLNLIAGLPFHWSKKGYVGKLAFDPEEFPDCDWIGLPERIVRGSPEIFERVEDDGIWLECPKCGAEQEDCDGFGVLFCPECGYCTHSSITNNKCDLCKRKVKIYEKETK